MKVQYVYKDSLSVLWTCVSCGRSNETKDAVATTTGGCFGHGPDEYCYCSPSEVELETKCKCGLKTIVKL